MSRLSTSQDLIRQHLPISSGPAIPTPLPQWLVAIPAIDLVVNRIGVTEFRRRIFHMTPALLPLALPFVPHSAVWGPILNGLVLLMAVSAIVMALIYASLLTRQNELSWMSAVVGYMVPVVAPLLLFRGHAELGLMTLQIIALGDGSATFGGLMLGGRRLPWNRKKTFTGLFCFFIVGTLSAAYSFWGETGVSMGVALVICGTSAFCAAIVESLPIESNDNLRVGTTALLVGMAMSAWIL